MMNTSDHSSLLAAILAAIALQVTTAAAQAQPVASRPVRIIVPFLGGDPADSMARIVVRKLDEKSAGAFAVENNPGDDSHFGAEIVAKTRPDGYTLLFAPITRYAAAASLRARLHYDLLADFTPVTLVANAPQVLVAHPMLPVKSVATLIALAKARPGQIGWASYGNSSLLELEMFRTLSGVSVSRVPFDDSNAALRALFAGDVELLFDSLATTLPHIRAGRLRAVAVAGSKRARALPELPTVAAAGVKGFESDHWFALLAPEGIEMPVVSRLNDDFAKAIGAGDVGERLLSLGFEAHRSTPAELGAIMRDNVSKWARVVKTSGMRPD